MAKMQSEISLKCEVTVIRLVFWPFATWTKVGGTEKLTVLGLPIYQKAGGSKKFLWKVWREYW